MDNLWTNWIQFTDISGETTVRVYAGMRVVLACLSVLPCDVDHMGIYCETLDGDSECPLLSGHE